MIIMKLVNYLTPIMVLLTIINTLIITFLKPATNIFFILLPLFLLTILIFIKGMLSHKKSVYKYNLNLYLFLYLLVIAILTLMYRRDFANKFIFHLIPGHLLIKFFQNDPKVTLFTVIYNYLGNFLLFIPFTILLMLINKKYQNSKKMFITLFLCTFIIEIIQTTTGLGEFDIDDFILNILGGMLTLQIILKHKFLPKITNFFNTNFHLKKQTLTLSYTINVIIIIIYNYLIFTI